MIDRSQFIDYYWTYYMLYERDFVSLLDSVALRPENLNTCSERIIQQLITACSGFETLVRSMYGLNSSKDNISVFTDTLKSDDGLLLVENVRLKTSVRGVEIAPFEKIRQGETPDWWKAHSKLKHDRISNYSMGNFANLLNALAALYALEILYAKEIGTWWYCKNGYKDPNSCDVPNDVSRLFQIPGLRTRHTVMGYEAYAITNEEIDAMFSERAIQPS